MRAHEYRHQADGTIETIDLRDGGRLLFCETFLEKQQADELFSFLHATVPWQQEGARGRRFPRLTAWYAGPGLTYSYSGVTHQALDWLPDLLEVKRRIEQMAQAEFNSLLLNLYRDGNDSIGMHADDEPELGTNPIIGSVSLGAIRQFVMKHKASGEKLTLDLTHGSALVMAGATQHYWVHGIPKTKKPVGSRINLTYRKILPG